MPFSVDNGYATLGISSINLKRAAEIVKELEKSPLVLQTSVNTAFTLEEASEDKEETAKEITLLIIISGYYLWFYVPIQDRLAMMKGQIEDTHIQIEISLQF